MTKVIHIISGLGSGGAEKILFQLVTKNSNPVQQHYVISLSDKGFYGEKLEAAGISVHTLNLKTNPQNFFQLRKLISNISPDIIQGWMYHGNVIASLVSLFVGMPKVVWGVHASNFSAKTTSLSTRSFVFFGSFLSWLSPRKIIYVSQAAKQAHEKITYKRSKSLVIANGIDTNIFTPNKDAYTNLRKQLSLHKSCRLIGLIARFHPLKGHQTFVDAAKIFIESGLDAHFLLCGANIDNNNKILMEMINRAGLSPRFHLLGQRENISQITAGLDIANSCSLDESFSLTAAEAMSCEVPTVVTANAGAMSVVGDKGHIVPIGDARNMASEWKKVLETPDEELKKKNRAARKSIKDQFSIETMLINYQELYNKLSRDLT